MKRSCPRLETENRVVGGGKGFSEGGALLGRIQYRLAIDKDRDFPQVLYAISKRYSSKPSPYEGLPSYFERYPIQDEQKVANRDE